MTLKADDCAIRPEQVVLVSDCYLGGWARSFQSAKRVTDANALFYFADDSEMAPLVAHQTRIGQGQRTPGKRFRMYLVECPSEDADEAGEQAAWDTSAHRYGQYAKTLKLSAFLRTPAVWRALGSDADFRDWVTRQPSIVSGGYSETDDAGEPRCVACHVRRADNAGTGYKPDYACVPMTDGEHRIQHDAGEAAVYAAHLRARGQFVDGARDLTEPAREWFDAQRIRCVETWAWAALKAHIGVESMADAHPDVVFDWAVGEGVAAHLPAAYRQADSREL